MISPSPELSDNQSERFSVLLSHFIYHSQSSNHEHSVLCRVLDGRDLVEPRAVDVAILTFEERAHYHAVYGNTKSGAIAVRTRAALRRMLAREIGVPAHLVQIHTDEHEKPRCTHPLTSDLDFSVSHSDDCSMISLGEASGVGVDIKKISDKAPSDDELNIAFNVEEYDAWASLPDPKRPVSFTQAWTIKEAFLKAMGLGLDGSPHDITVRFDARGDAWPIFPSSYWMFERINFCSSYAASFVALMLNEGEEQE